MPLVPHHSETVDVSLTEIYEDTASPCVGVNSAVTKYKHVGNESTEPTIDHSKTGQQPFFWQPQLNITPPQNLMFPMLKPGRVL